MRELARELAGSSRICEHITLLKGKCEGCIYILPHSSLKLAETNVAALAGQLRTELSILFSGKKDKVSNWASPDYSTY